MKKIIAIAFLITLVAAPVFAAGEYDSDTKPIVVPTGLADAGDTVSVLSKNVTANVVSSATRFAAATAHTSGSKQYGTTSESTSMFASDFEEGVTGKTLVAPSVSDTTSFDGWTTL